MVAWRCPRCQYQLQASGPQSVACPQCAFVQLPPAAGATTPPPPPAPPRTSVSPRPPNPRRSALGPLMGSAGVVLVVGALVGGLFLTTEPDASASANAAVVNSQLEVHAAPGQTVELELEFQPSIKGLWAAPDGISGTISTPDGSSSVVVFDVPAGDPDWGNDIYGGESRTLERGSVRSRFVVPDDVAVGTVLEGSVKVQTVRPVVVTSSLNQNFFEDRSHSGSVGVRLIIDDVARGAPVEYLWLTGLAGLVGLMLLVGGIILARRSPKAPTAPAQV